MKTKYPAHAQHAPEAHSHKKFPALATHSPEIIVDPPAEPTKAVATPPKPASPSAKVLALLLFVCLFLFAPRAGAQYAPGTLNLGASAGSTNAPGINTNAPPPPGIFSNPPAGPTYFAVQTDTNGNVIWPGNFKSGLTSQQINNASGAFFTTATNYIFGGNLTNSDITQNSYVVTNCPTTAYNGKYVYWFTATDSGYIRYFYTNSNAGYLLDFIPAITEMDLTTSTNIGTRSYQATGATFMSTNIVTYPGLAATTASIWTLSVSSTAPVQQFLNAQNHVGSHSGDINGVTNMQMQLPYSATWNNGTPVPIIAWTSWGGYQWWDFTLTNTINYIKANGLPIDSLMFDESVGAAGRDSNGNIMWDTNLMARFPLPTFITYLHTNGFKADIWLTIYTNSNMNASTMSTAPGYFGSPIGLLKKDLETIHSWGADGVVIDHAVAYAGADDRNISFQAAITLQDRISAWQANTNNVANGIFAENTTPFRVQWYDISRNPAAMNLAAAYSYGGDVPLSANAPQAAYTGVQAETNYTQMVNFYTNMATWVGPGHTISAIGLSDQTAAADVTNVINLCALEAFSAKLQNLDNSHGAVPTAMQRALTNTAPGNTVSIWKDPLVKMGLPVASWSYATDVRPTELWVKPLTGGKYAFAIWNHSVTNTVGVAFSLATINPTLANLQAVIHDPWGGLDVQTNITGTFSYSNIPPMSVVLFTANPTGPAGITLAQQSELPLTCLTPSSQDVFLGNYWVGPVAAGGSAYFNFVPYQGKTNFTLVVNAGIKTAGTTLLKWQMHVNGVTNGVQSGVGGPVNYVTSGATNVVVTITGSINPALTPNILTLHPVFMNDGTSASSVDIGWAKLIVGPN